MFQGFFNRQPFNRFLIYPARMLKIITAEGSIYCMKIAEGVIYSIKTAAGKIYRIFNKEGG